MKMQRISFVRRLFAAVALSGLLASVACSREFKDIVISEENRTEIEQTLRENLTVQEADLVSGYVTRLFPDLKQGQLPSGRSLSEMIASQRAYLSQPQTSENAVSETVMTEPPQQRSSAEPQAVGSGLSRTQAEATRTAGGPTDRDDGQEQMSQDSTPTPPAPASQGSSVLPERQAPDQQVAVAELEQEALPEAPATAVLPAGTALKVRLTERIGSQTNQAGDLFGAEMDQDLVVDGQVVARSGDRLVGKIVDAKRAGRVRGKASMSIELEKLIAGGEKSYSFKSNRLRFEADGTAKRDAKRVGIATGIGAVIGAIAGGGSGAAIGSVIGAGASGGMVIATRGKEVEFPIEQAFEFQLQEAIEADILP